MQKNTGSPEVFSADRDDCAYFNPPISYIRYPRKEIKDAVEALPADDFVPGKNFTAAGRY